MEALLSAVSTYSYLFLVIAAIIEGPIVSLLAGVLIRTDALLLLPTATALIIGDLIGDMVWYAVGYYGGDRFVSRFGKYISTTEAEVEIVKRIFHRYHERILLFSKITTGFGLALATLIAAGMTRIPFKKYMALNTVGQFVWTGMLLSIGYYLGDFYLTASSILSKISLFGVFVILLFLFLGFRSYLRKRLSETV